MKTLAVEDDFTSRLLLRKILGPYGEAHAAANGQEAVNAFRLAVEEKQPYDLVCLDIMMPGMDGHAVLSEIRKIEESNNTAVGSTARVVMTSALGDPENVLAAFRNQCEGYLVKPIDKAKLLEQLRSLGLIQ